MHPSSVNRRPALGPRDGWYVYEQKFETSKLFVNGTTRTSPHALLLFGAKSDEISIEKVGGFLSVKYTNKQVPLLLYYVVKYLCSKISLQSNIL
jgi:hypothetical protein